MNRVIIVLVTVLSLPVFLHSGRTDSNGGHYDRSTGEYHYHHGYSAHDHYDMDGDGIADCPFSFKDNTINVSESSNNKKHGNSLGNVVSAVLVVSGLVIVPWGIQSIFVEIRKYNQRK